MTASPRASFPFRLEFPPDLPITARAQEIVDLVQAHPVIILAGETGSGKTTQIPKLCLAAGRGQKGQIACTQPRRVAALSVSRRVAEELNVEWGRAVGCKVRFTDQTSRDTVIKFLTDGMLLAEVQSDPLLRSYDTIIIDEAHERSLNIDFLLGHLRQLRFKRPELRIIITSATIDTAVFSKAFDDAPVIEVSGRTYPVEVIYAPLDGLGSDQAEGDEPQARAEALHYIDGAVAAVERILSESSHGDVLVFMPAERDIRETVDLLAGRATGCELVPLFGRLTNAEQQRVFAASTRRKVIVATNIAETSLTIPGIRYVVDTGLARISRYAAQARTRRLPIEPVAQSSADQRKGRAGRVAAGVCIRLYGEKDYLERPCFASPEIQRANLADVILRLKAFGLGDIERFPFINMPATKSIRAGYALLEELGAIEREAATGETGPEGETEVAGVRHLTQLGRELAQLPVDPTVGRMILQARREKAVREVLVIAAGLSIQDPRERPLEQQAAADAAHRRFAHPDSDFLTLLNIWEALHDEFDRLSQSRMRRWCREHFLSYTRLREWRDIYHQLLDTLEGRRDFQLSSVWDGAEAADREQEKLRFGTPGYRAIHRSILAGLLGNIAARDDQKGGYLATHDRRATLFPGSALFRREEKKPGKAAAGAAREGRGPRWIMAAEIMETSRLYARTCARLDPQWALDLGRHVLRVTHSEPFWDEAKARVMVRQRTRLYGLEIDVRAVAYGPIDPAHATEIFIREALVNDTLTWPFDFLQHNRAVRAQLENQLTRLRDRGYLNLDEAIYRYYTQHLLPATETEDGERLAVSSVPELIELVRAKKAQEPRFLEFDLEDLRDPEELSVDATAFPEALPLQQTVLPLTYAYKPGQPDDGVTIEVGVAEADELTPAALDWAVPGHLAAKIEHYLRALPKELRRAVHPLAETTRSLAEQLAQRDRLTGRRESLTEALAARLGERFQLRLDPAVWADKPLPDHLRVRVRVVDTDGRELAASRELPEIRRALDQQALAASRSIARDDPGLWRQARREWETPEQDVWPRDVVPEEIVIGEQAGVPVKAFPALEAGRGGVALRLCRTPEDAARLMPQGLSALLETSLRYDLAWLEKDLRALKSLGPLVSTLVPVATLQEQAFTAIRRELTNPSRVPARQGARTADAFTAAVEKARVEVKGLVPRLVDQLREILALRQSLLVHPTPYAGLETDLAGLLPPDFLLQTPYPQLAELARYLRGMQLRAERWRQNPPKDNERARQLAPYVRAISEITGLPGGSDYRWLVEEFRVSLFAQELGTALPVSSVKLDRRLAQVRAGDTASDAPTATATAAGAAAKPRPVVVAPASRGKPLKSLNALDGLFGRGRM